MSNDYFNRLSALLPQLQQNEPLSKHCTIRVGGPAAAFLVVKSCAEIVGAVQAARTNSVPIHILGGGSNTLFSDHGFAGLVIKNMANHVEVAGSPDELDVFDELDALDRQSLHQTEAEVRHEAADPTKYVSFLDLNYEERPGDTLIKAESGVNLTALIIKSLDSGLAGLQWFGGIPGVIGGAIYNNIHGGTRFIAERLVEISVISDDNSVTNLSKAELKFAYDYSRLHETKEIILSASFLLTKATAVELERDEYTFREWTKRKSQMQPKLGSIGSTFQNVSQAVRLQTGAPTTAAGWFIDRCGLKGKMIGKAQIAQEHANFIINTGGASASDVYQLMALAQRNVKKQFGVFLRPEIFMVGEFDGSVQNGH